MIQKQTIILVVAVLVAFTTGFFVCKRFSPKLIIPKDVITQKVVDERHRLETVLNAGENIQGKETVFGYVRRFEKDGNTYRITIDPAVYLYGRDAVLASIFYGDCVVPGLTQMQTWNEAVQFDFTNPVPMGAYAEEYGAFVTCSMNKTNFISNNIINRWSDTYSYLVAQDATVSASQIPSGQDIKSLITTQSDLDTYLKSQDYGVERAFYLTVKDNIVTTVTELPQ